MPETVTGVERLHVYAVPSRYGSPTLVLWLPEGGKLAYWDDSFYYFETDGIQDYSAATRVEAVVERTFMYNLRRYLAQALEQ
jgi:hypothetical protein